ncbi:hypothetical protein CKA32_006646 [Geitlerinema sp. FC II]|nr:hypothetical protein CKA32_006646 [Geitlerinema sp. FC II]
MLNFKVPLAALTNPLIIPQERVRFFSLPFKTFSIRSSIARAIATLDLTQIIQT